jgi:hypothetical protein
MYIDMTVKQKVKGIDQKIKSYLKMQLIKKLQRKKVLRYIIERKS